MQAQPDEGIDHRRGEDEVPVVREAERREEQRGDAGEERNDAKLRFHTFLPATRVKSPAGRNIRTSTMIPNANASLKAVDT